MKRKSVAILGVVLVMLLLTLSHALATGGSDESEMKQAREIAQGEIVGHVDVFPEWQGAEAMDGQPYCNMEGEVICYWFTVSKEGKVLGNVVVGSRLYDHVVFKLGTGYPPSVPIADEVRVCLEKDMGLKTEAKDIGEPLYLVYATYSFYFAIYEINEQEIGIDLMRRKAVPASDLQMGITSPEQYKQYVKERETKSELDGSLPIPPSPPSLDKGIAPPGQLEQDKEEVEGKGLRGETKLTYFEDPLPLDMSDEKLYNAHESNNNCGPTSGSMIVVYNKDEQDYDDFDIWPTCHSDNITGDGGLYETMNCNDWWPPHPGVLPYEAGPGWIEYADDDCGYDNFVTRDENSDPDFYTYEK